MHVVRLLMAVGTLDVDLARHRDRVGDAARESGPGRCADLGLPSCPRATLFDASERDYRTVLVADATSQTTPERLADLESIGVRVLSVDEVSAGLSSLR